MVTPLSNEAVCPRQEDASAWERAKADANDSGALSLDSEEDAELLKDWAATSIQRQWQQWRFNRLEITKGSMTDSRPSSVCCTCFAPINHTETSRPLSASLLCVSCRANLHRGQTTFAYGGSPMTASLASPLPKLSRLVQTEAKYQQQLQLLRQQQELLRQQQQEIEMRKQLQSETAALDKKIARQRRKQFQLLMMRRQEEERQRQQEMESATMKECRSQPDSEQAIRRKPRSTPSAEVSSSSSNTSTSVDPTQLRHHRIPPPNGRARAVEAAASKAAEIAEKAAREHRRRQKVEMMKCYAQDLTPLVHGHKPTKLPIPALPTAQGRTKKNQGSAFNSKLPVKPSKIVQLAPIQPNGLLAHSTSGSSNQFEHSESSALRVAIPKRPTYDAATFSFSQHETSPLTAEIKPASWMYDLLTSDPVLSDATQSSPFVPNVTPVGFGLSMMPLTTLREENGEDQELPTVTSERMTLAPLVPPATSVQQPAAYSSERLASLLQKYNVSITKTSPS